MILSWHNAWEKTERRSCCQLVTDYSVNVHTNGFTSTIQMSAAKYCALWAISAIARRMWPELPAQFAKFSDNEGIEKWWKRQKTRNSHECKLVRRHLLEKGISTNQLTISHDQFNSRASKEIDRVSTVHGGKAKCLFSPMYWLPPTAISWMWNSLCLPNNLNILAPHLNWFRNPTHKHSAYHSRNICTTFHG